MSSYSFKHFYAHSEIYKYFINLATQIKQDLSELFLVKTEQRACYAVIWLLHIDQNGCSCECLYHRVNQWCPYFLQWCPYFIKTLASFPSQSSRMCLWFHWVCDWDFSLKCHALAFHLRGWIYAKDSVRWRTRSRNPGPLCRTHRFLHVLPTSAAFSSLNHSTDRMTSTQWLKGETDQC